MNHITQLTPKEWQLLSAYLDDQISPRERIQIEKKLASEDAFRQAFENLRQTRTVIRAMPRRRVPRNFTLTPDMVPVKRGLSLLPVFRLSSAVAAIAAVALFALQLLPTMMRAGAPAAAPAALEMAAAAEQPASTEPPLIFWGEPDAQAEKGAGGYGGGDGSAYGLGGGAPDTFFGAPVYAATPNIQFDIPQETVEPGVGAAATDAYAAPAVEATPYPTPTPYSEETEAPAMEEALQATAAPETERGLPTLEGNPVLGLRPEESGKVIAQSQPMEEDFQAVEVEQPSTWRDLLLPAAIGMAALALLTAIAAFVLWKKSRG